MTPLEVTVNAFAFAELQHHVFEWAQNLLRSNTPHLYCLVADHITVGDEIVLLWGEVNVPDIIVCKTAYLFETFASPQCNTSSVVSRQVGPLRRNLHVQFAPGLSVALLTFATVVQFRLPSHLSPVYLCVVVKA